MSFRGQEPLIEPVTSLPGLAQGSELYTTPTILELIVVAIYMGHSLWDPASHLDGQEVESQLCDGHLDPSLKIAGKGKWILVIPGNRELRVTSSAGTVR